MSTTKKSKQQKQNKNKTKTKTKQKQNKKKQICVHALVLQEASAVVEVPAQKPKKSTPSPLSVVSWEFNRIKKVFPIFRGLGNQLRDTWCTHCSHTSFLKIPNFPHMPCSAEFFSGFLSKSGQWRKFVRRFEIEEESKKKEKEKRKEERRSRSRASLRDSCPTEARGVKTSNADAKRC